MGKLLVVDGSNLLFQMFYGMPSRILGHNGKPIQGTLGFVGALLRILHTVQPTHVTVVFDGENHNPRKDLDEDYKANRPDYSQMAEEENPFSQLPDIYAALNYMGIAHKETTDCEADDWMAGFARRYGQEEDVVIASYDSDLFQLIGEKVYILRYRGEKTVHCDEAYLKRTLGIAPCQYAAHKALTGDQSDNIRGIPGIGPKTATALLTQFGCLEMLLAQPEQIKKTRIREAVLEHRERVLLNHRLIVLKGEGDLPFSWEEMAWEERGYTTTQVLQAIGLR